MCCVGLYCWIIHTSAQRIMQWQIYWSQFTFKDPGIKIPTTAQELRFFTYTVTLNRYMTVQFTEASRYVQCTENAIKGLPMNIKTAVFNNYWNIYKTYILDITVLDWQVTYVSSQPVDTTVIRSGQHWPNCKCSWAVDSSDQASQWTTCVL